MAADISIESVKGQVGTLVLDRKGAVISASGDFERSPELALILYRILLNANSLISDDPNDKFQRISIHDSKGFSYVMTLTKDRIFAIKK